MRRYLTLAVLGILLLAPSLASAQILSGFYRGGRGGNYYDNYGSPSYGWGGYRGYNSYRDSYPYYNSAPNYYSNSPGTSYYSTPSYSNDMSPSYSGVYQAGYNTPLGNRVRLQIMLPDPNAELLIQGQRMNTMGPTRTFVSPDLEPGKTYSYTIIMRRPTVGAGGEECRTIDVQPGGTYTIDFSKPSGERMNSDRERDERLTAPRSDNNVPSSEQPKSNTPQPPKD